MKKILIALFLLCNFCLGANWFELLDKKYVDVSTTSINNMGYVSFWIKALNKNGDEVSKIWKNYWYSVDKFSLDCKNKKISTDVVMIYDLKEKLIYSDELPYHEWHSIAPDTYADAYYRYFCIFPFEENPLLKH